MARAELTKSGFVYVISNIGSFGEQVFKIGMTRRLDPMDRIYELSDASVPFPFDLHAMLYSDNAPELEAALHQLVNERAVNLVNPRKEFYRDVELDEIESFVRSRGLSAQFIKAFKAKEFRQSLAMKQQHSAATPVLA
ncbi:MAG: GIY-YIG nuclease family protein [Acidobacteriia bacterium]|nr:GIY-YIG nuclease family protein [Terriglobia bacterium]